MWALLIRDLRLAVRRKTEALLPLVFFLVAASLFPLGVGPEPQMLRTIAPGVVWVCALLAVLLSLSGLYASDYADGSLEQMALSGRSLSALALAKALAHWLINGLPLVLMAPILGLLFGVPGPELGMLVLSLLLGTPVLSLLGGVGAALTLGVRSGGMLMFLLVLPLAIPALIFGAGAVTAFSAGLSPQGHLSLLGALMLLTLLGAPWATAAALKIALD
ncbi:MAG TPA: heme exporter protein CcmB [Aquabacterium sp.]|nr:heme exporter protein CcmB [Aquabacterium sp.]